MALDMAQVQQLVGELALIRIPGEAALLDLEVQGVDGEVDERVDVSDVVQNLSFRVGSKVFG